MDLGHLSDEQCRRTQAVPRAPDPGNKTWLFVGLDRGVKCAAMMYSLIGTARLNRVDPFAWHTDVLARIADLLQSLLHELMPWEWIRLREAPLIKEAGQ